MDSHRRKTLIRSLLAKNDPILVAEEYSGATPLHLGLEFLEISDETISGSVERCGRIFIFTPTDEAYESHEKSDEGDMGWADDAEEDEHRFGGQMGTISRPKRRSETQLCIDDWLLKHGARGKTAELLSRIQIIRVKDLVQLAVCLSTFPTPNAHLPNSLKGDESRSRTLIMVHDMSILPFSSTLSPPSMAAALASPSSPARSASGPLQDDIQEQNLSAYVAIAGHALAAVDFVAERFLMLDSGLARSSLEILRCYLDEDIEMDYSDPAV